MTTDTAAPSWAEVITDQDGIAHTTARTSGRSRRIEVLTGPERRRRWSVEQKQAIVAESYRDGISPTAVRFDRAVPNSPAERIRYELFIRPDSRRRSMPRACSPCLRSCRRSRHAATDPARRRGRDRTAASDDREPATQSFGRKSKQLGDEQFQQGLDDLEQSLAEQQAGLEAMLPALGGGSPTPSPPVNPRSATAARCPRICPEWKWWSSRTTKRVLVAAGRCTS